MTDLTVSMLQWGPEQGPPEQLLLLFHGVGANAADLTPLAETLRQAFPASMVMAFNGFEPFDGDPTGHARQWFSLQGITEINRVERVAALVPPLAQVVDAAQRAAGVGQQATALVGFSQGAIVSLALAQQHDGLVGRVLAFSGRHDRLPDQALRSTTLHYFHGAADPVIPVQHARDALQRQADLGGDATLDIAEGVGHEIAPALMQRALHRLRSHIPARTWAAALGAVPPMPAAPEDPH